MHDVGPAKQIPPVSQSQHRVGVIESRRAVDLGKVGIARTIGQQTQRQMLLVVIIIRPLGSTKSTIPIFGGNE